VKPEELGRMWLTDQAKRLRKLAKEHDGAYSPDSRLGHACAHVAAAYRQAADHLAAAARCVEEGMEMVRMDREAMARLRGEADS